MPIERLGLWLQTYVDQHPAASSLAVLGRNVAAIVARPVSMSPFD
ncbi:hypothetical protein [Bradyrhizobium sp. WSM2254]|nr:hypothetical protein [Bradyrhizobium sp. WSM2254]